MPNITSADDKYYYAGDKKIAKGGLSTAKRKEFDAMLPMQTMTPNPTTAYDPRFDAPGAQIENINSLEQIGINPNAVSSAAVAPALNVSNPAIVPPAAMAPVMNAMPATNVQPPSPPVQPMQPMIARQSVQTDTQKGFQAPKDIEKNIAESYKQRIEAAKEIGIAEQKASQEILKEQQKTDIELAQQDYMRQQIDARKQAAVAEAMDKYQSTIKELDDAKVDPDRFYGGSVGKRVLAAITIGLGEFSRIWTGGSTNNALNIINKAIDDDMAAQRVNITQLGNKASLQRQMMQDLRAKYDDEVSGNLAVRAAMLDQAQRKVLQIGTGLKSEQAKANAADMAAKLDQEKNNSLLQLAQLTGDKTATRTMTEYAQPTGRDEKQVNENIINIRKERNALQTTKETVARTTALNTLKSAKELADKDPKNTGEADIMFITSFMKMIDPGSVVRENEFKLAEGAGGKGAEYLNFANKVLRGGRITPEVRNRYMALAEKEMEKQRAQQNLADKPFRLQAERLGLPLEMIFEGETPAEKPASELIPTFQPRGK